MASNLPGSICLADHSICILRGALLDTDCSVVGGADSGFVTAGIITLTYTPVYADERRIQPRNGCGTRLFSVVRPGQLESATITADIGFQDPEMKQILFGGTLLTAKAGVPWAGAVGGYASPTADDALNAPVYLEAIVETAGQGVGDCADPDEPFPPWKGYIFGKARLTEDALTLGDAEHNVSLTGTVEGNPNLVFGPWNDYPNTGVVPNSPKVEVYYSQEQYEEIAEAAGCGYVTLPAPYS